MTRNYYTSSNYNAEHSTCGSVIDNYDFGGYTSMASIAEQIFSDWKFDERCQKNAQNLNRYKKGEK